MKPVYLALGGLLVFLLGKTRARPVVTKSSPSLTPATALPTKPPVKGQRSPPAKKAPSAPKPTAPRPTSGKVTSPYQKASSVFRDAVVRGLTEEQARTAALAAYKKAGGKSPQEISKINQMIYWD
jgi:hypothetical protein